ncbi:hypothetical protein DPMN_042577 [Dreissena polymorpha]|uniref:Uncharacterized protein n=1 Tax=Dreissena polymorpha TaxID=45954 RepID=A0A9D4D0R4_DREPO|nr:hypothetical protein DPMN_042577 [Dreissena polymorpha]
MPTITLKVWLNLFNRVYRTCTVPPEWKQATVIPIPKPSKDKNDPNSYHIEVTSFQTLVRLCTRLAETKKTVVCHLKVLVIGVHSVAVTEDLRGDQFPDIGSLLLVYEIGRD